MRPYNPDAMGKTFAEKALARAAGKAEVSAGQIVDARPDRVLSHDNTAAIYRLFRQLGVEKVKHPERLCITLDHAAPAPTTQHAQNHAEVRAFVRAQGVRHFFEVGRGICHQVLSEEALVLPGMTILGADSHTTHFGWLGAFGAGVGRSEVAALWATGELWLRVPESMKVVLTGQLPPWVTTKDLCLKLIGDLGQDGGLYRSVEFHGDAIRALSLDSRMVIPNMMAEFGAKNAYLPPDEAVFDYLERRLRRRWQAAQAQGDADEMRTLDAQLETLRSAALYPDPDAEYVSGVPLRPERAGADGGPAASRGQRRAGQRGAMAGPCIKPGWARAPTAGWRTSRRPARCCAGGAWRAPRACFGRPLRLRCYRRRCAWVTPRSSWKPVG
jgi:3-isopropylmalate/(R)-2-methylmalate dehydratase large subunit